MTIVARSDGARLWTRPAHAALRLERLSQLAVVLHVTNLLQRLVNFWKLRIVRERGRELRWVIARRFQ